MQRKKAGYERKKRNTGHREPRPVIYIAGEGNVNKTESLYFQSFKTSRYCVQFVQEGYSNPKGIVRKLKSKINDKRGIEFNAQSDRAFCLIDTDCDNTKNGRIEEALREAEKDRKIPIEIITSNPCFEIWFILHERYTAKKYNSSSEVVSDLRKIKGWESYNKGDTDTYRKTIKNVQKAIRNARKLETKHLEEGIKPHTVEFMPSSGIYKLVEILLQEEMNDSTP